MGSITDYIECPRCKTDDCISDFNYKTGEEFIFCNSCGYAKSFYIINRDKLIKDLTDNDWKCVEIKEPYCCYRLSYKNNNTVELKSIETIEEYNMFLNIVLNNYKNIEYLKISKFDGEKIIKLDLKELLRLKKLKKLLYEKRFNENI